MLSQCTNEKKTLLTYFIPKYYKRKENSDFNFGLHIYIVSNSLERDYAVNYLDNLIKQRK